MSERKVVPLRLDLDTLGQLDEARAGDSRQAWLERLVKDRLAGRLQQPPRTQGAAPARDVATDGVARADAFRQMRAPKGIIGGSGKTKKDGGKR